MKKLIIVLVLLFAATALFAQDFSALPSGRWLDHNFNAIWEFSAAGIKLSTAADGDIFTFTTRNIQNLRPARSGTQAGISFACEATGRSYTFVINITNNVMTMTIQRDGLPEYQVQMQKQ
ncbi:MAG: hypothetical protein FWC12_12100 [Treponema sp.]|nr:hypothetical protein [Treponema sp.]